MQAPAKVAIASTVVLLLSLGLCGLSISQMNSDNSGDIAFLSILGMIAGAIGLLVAGIMAIVSASTKK